ncbi:hypothetical protein [Geodermatophilus ruber]|uniref:Uncharacterized protein n=1 Tax=Geodermatophilus ruber TaxID=504800 RepID=A0A1I4CYC5_9ACTN|nr:hypothetical protein [Geodermatophilus ruber]SFK85895.1 hypothetical protein SAMN04488085_10471 [Geodermatophilus ruber]
MISHYMTTVPLRIDGARLIEADCWMKPFDLVALGCACGYRHRLLDAADLGLNALHEFYGDPADDALERLTAELQESDHAAAMVPALLDWAMSMGAPEHVGGQS